MHEAGAVGRLSVLVRLRIERPQLLSRLRIERDDAVVLACDTYSTLSIISGVFWKLPGRVPNSSSGASSGRHSQAVTRLDDVGAVDVGQGRELGAAGITAVDRPLLHGRLGADRQRRRQQDRRAARAGYACGPQCTGAGSFR